MQRQILAGKCVPMGIAENKCGSCNQCCISFDIPEIGKKAGVPCRYLTQHGCGIYQNRPPTCRNFQCAWLKLELKPMMRPNRCGFILSFDEASKDGLRAICYKNSLGSVCRKAKKWLEKKFTKNKMPILWRNPDGTYDNRGEHK